jgi:hypothetical protein|tara:strand:+ start:24711 stop:25004 length:294 start_codon:yes stop_codon:yes gene_type:complete
MKITKRQLRRIIEEALDKNQQYSISAETYKGEWELLQDDLVRKHPSLKAIKTSQDSDLEIGLVVGRKEDLWAFESEYVNPVNYSEYRAAFERRVKPY